MYMIWSLKFNCANIVAVVVYDLIRSIASCVSEVFASFSPPH